MRKIALVAVWATVAASASGLTARSYVQKGLKASYDGIDNAGTGTHDPTARTWTDLTGNGHDGTLADIVTWGDDGWSTTVSGRPVKLPNTLSSVTATRNFTVECAFSPSRGEKSTAARETVFGQYAGNNNGTFNIEHNHGSHPAGCLRIYLNKGEIDAFSSGCVLADQNATVALAVTPARQVLYIDGVSDIVSAKSLTRLDSSKDSYIGGEPSRENMGFRGTYYGCRVYDRALTAEEVAVNNAVDAIRYRGASASDFTLSGGYSFDAEGELLVDLTATAGAGGQVRAGDGAFAASAVVPVNQDGTASATFTAAPDAGYEFVAWSLEDGATLTAGNLTSPTIGVSARWPLAVTAVFREAGRLTARSYVQKGLAACWDGIDNAGTGEHSATTRTWKDLTGNGYDGALGDAVGWAETGWTNAAAAKPIALGYGISSVIASRTFTLEFTTTPSRAPCRELFFGSFNWGGVGTINFERKANGRLRCHYNNGEIDFESASAIGANETASFTVTTTPGRQTVWKNGVKDKEQTAKEISSLSAGKPTYIGAEDVADTDNTRKYFNFQGVYHGCRVYGRVLTDEEIAVNNAVDAIRYRGASASDFTLSGGYSFDASGNLLVDISAAAMAGGTVRAGEGAAAATAVASVNQDGSAPVYFTAVPDAGYEFVAWNVDDGGLFLSGGAGDATIGIAAKWPIGMTAVFRPARTSFATTEGAEYVKNGLLVWYDGVDNAGAGRHDDSASAWTDLSGNGYDGVAICSGLGWTANACTNGENGTVSDAGLFRLPGVVGQTIAARTFTLELALRPAFAKERKVFFGSYNGATGFNLEEVADGMFRIFFNNRPNIITTVPLVKDEDTVFSVVSTADSACVYKNGVLVYRYEGEIDATGTLAGLLETSTYYLGGEKEREGFTYRGAIYSFRLYGRALAPDEVARNTLLDRQRLLTRTTAWTDSAGGAWADAAKWSDGTPNAYVPGFLALAGADIQLALAQAVPPVGSLSLANAVGATKLTLGDDAVLPLRDNSLAVGAGAELAVEAGGRLDFQIEGTNPNPWLSVSDGGTFAVNGGAVTLDNVRSSIAVFGSEGRTGTLEVASGSLSATVVHNGQHGVSVQKGGLLRVSGGELTLARKGKYAEGSGLLTDGGEVDISGSAKVSVQRMGVRFGPGRIRLAGSSVITTTADNPDTVSHVRLCGGAGQETVMTVEDSASIVRTDGDRMNFYIGDNIAGSRAVLNWDSTGTLDARSSLAIGFRKGYGELNISRGQVIGGSTGARIAQGGYSADAGNYPTGVVNITGGSLRNMSASNNADTFQGLIVGAGASVDLSNPGFYRGTLNLYGGAVTNSSEYFGIGIGFAEGDLNQYAGEVIHSGNQNEFVIGAFGGKGTMVMEGGRAWSKSAVFVGGATTNALYYKRYKLYTLCPVDNHRATGLLRVDAGTFDSANTIWVSQDGQGTLEIGPAGAVSANDVVLTNTPAALTGTTDLAAKLKFTLGESGAGSLVVTNMLTIGQGVTLEVDATGRNGKGGTFPLVRFGESEGEFSSVTVQGPGRVTKATVDGVSGYWYRHTPGTMFIIR